MTGKDVLEKLREQLIDLSVKKGYSAQEIKSALDTAGIVMSVKAIKEAAYSDPNRPLIPMLSDRTFRFNSTADSDLSRPNLAIRRNL